MPDSPMEKLYYEDIFNQNGASYHKAMDLWPNARDKEFNTALTFLDLNSGDTVLDVPAGGGYLKAYLPDNVRYSGYDFSTGFGHDAGEIAKCSETDIPIADNSVDHIICLAALHHVENRTGFYAEAKRVLKANGTLLIGDIITGSTQDHFLNGFVDHWNKLGHQGDFILPRREAAELASVGMSSRYSEREYEWCFQSRVDAQDYFRLLFTMNKTPPTELLDQQLDKLGARQEDTQFTVQWHLGFIVATP